MSDRLNHPPGVRKTDPRVSASPVISSSPKDQILEAAGVGIISIDPDGNPTYINPMAAEILGYAPDEFLGRNSHETFHRHDAEGSLYDINDCPIRTTLLSGKKYQGDDYFWRKSGSGFPVELSSMPIFEEGRITGSVITFRDITDRRKAEEDLRQSEERYKSLFQENSSIMLLIDPDTGEIKDANPAASLFYGWSKPELCLKNISEINTLTREEVFAEMRKAKGEKRKHFLFKHLLANQEIRDVEVYSGPLNFGSATLLYSIIHDITDEVNAKRDSLRSESKYRNLVENINEVIYEVDPEGIIQYISPAIEKITGFAAKDIIGMNFTGFVGENADYLTKRFRILGEKKEINHEYKLPKKDGGICWVRLSTKAVFEGDCFKGGYGTLTDVTEKKLSEESLRKLSQAVEQSPVMTCITDLKGTIEYVNPKATELTGYTRAELTGKNPRILNSGEKPREAYDILWQTISSGKEWKGEFHNKKKNGELYWVSASINPVMDDAGKVTHYLAVEEDITQRKMTEEALLQSEAELNLAQEIAQMGSWNLNLKTNKVGWSMNYYRLIGLEPYEIEPSNDYFMGIIHPDDLHLIEYELQELINNKRDHAKFDMRIMRPDGAVKWVQNNLVALIEDGVITGLKGVNIDITEKKLAEAEINDLNINLEHKIVERTAQLAVTNDNLLKEIEERKRAESDLIQMSRRLTLAARAGGVGIWEFEIDSNNLLWDNQMFMLYGIKRENSSGAYEAWKEGFHPDDADRGDSEIQMAIRGEKEFDTEFRVVWPDGTIHNIRALAIVERDPSGRATHLIGTNWDITDQKRNEILLDQIRQNYQSFFNTIDDFLFVLDVQGNIIHTNQTVIDRLGYTAEELFGQSVLMVHPVERREEAGRIVGEMLAGTADFCPVPLITREGNRIPVETKVKPGYWDGEPVIFGWTKDVSKIKLSEEKFSKAFQTNSALMAISGFDDGKYMDVNDMFLSTLGYTREEIIGRTSAALNLFVNSEIRRTIIRKIVNNEPVREFELDIKTKAGSIRTGLFSAEPIFIGKDYCLLTVMVDITERKRTEEVLRWNQSLLQMMSDSSPLGFLVVDNRTDDILYFNHRFCEIWEIGHLADRMRRGEMKNNDIIPDCLPVLADVPAFAESCKPLQDEANRVVVKDEIAFTKDRTVQRFSTQIRGENDEYYGRFYIFEDITERKRAEKEIWKAREEADRANLAKSEFLSRMSHELRTPMNSILGFAQLMEMGELVPSHKKGLHHIMTSGKHLLNLINEVLDISRIEAGRMSLSLEPVGLTEIFNELTAVIQQQALTRQISIELADSGSRQLFVKADNQRLKQVLLNLINNAIKYNQTGGSIMIDCKVMPTGGFGTDPVRISIKDTGSGISDMDLPKLFKPFERIGAEKSETEGTGLGLAVVKKLMEAMGGNVGVESMPGEGSTFWIELPFAEDPKIRQEKAAVRSDPGAGGTEKAGTILYIEDNMSNIELVENILLSQREGILLVAETNGRKAVQQARDTLPDLILLDLDLPDIHGEKVLDNLQANAGTKSIPVVIISADAMPEQIGRLMLAGARDYLTKPIDIKMFLSIVDEWVGSN